ncbi:hypothetical protein B0A52_08588 [Exophiala mesophila]|uniref:BCD1 alpha/beta domain-containing protein n=1 Tax=Exophiala mesophila TaxID=212818 RepID=A0A438MTY4_EXOME|nr:hypothetical protein B0A52_08588 [Exophiala mesophila]
MPCTYMLAPLRQASQVMGSMFRIDQDFNFISSVERSLSKADELVSDKGITLAPSGIKRHDFKRKLDIEFEQRQITVIKAPQGLSRSKQNKTHWAGAQNAIMWTTEWLCHNGINLSANALESKTVREVFVMISGRKLAQGKRKRSDAGKRELNHETNLVSTTQHLVKGDNSISSFPHNVDQTPSSPEISNVTESHKVRDEEAKTETTMEPVLEKPKPTSSRLAEPPILDPGLHFYLHNPQTAAKYKCLIPISADMTLREVLEGRTIVEFPSFYVRTESPDTLPAPLIVQEKYDEIHRAQLPIDVLPTYPPNDITTELDERVRPWLTEVDEKKVLEVLQKDLTG